ncbi:MAG TPA: DUF5947 family protein [Pyrinomonadaceae bacterium]
MPSIEKIEGLVRAVEELPDPSARASALELVQALMDFHGEALDRLMEIVAAQGESGHSIFHKFSGDELVSTLLLVYGLHPLPPKTRVYEATRFVQIQKQATDNKDINPDFLRVVRGCDLCSIELGPDHPHLVEPATRRLVCACQACAILFSSAAETKYRRVPSSVRYLPDFHLTDAQWEGLMIPINMAFFFQSSAAGKVIVLYPSPAGATESLLDFESWQEIVAGNPVLQEMEADTEALLVNRVQGAADHFIVPIDECYRLVGLIRTKWKGLAGGTEVWEAINSFFTELRRRAKGVAEIAHA